jgi:two-component system response regulator RegA
MLMRSTETDNMAAPMKNLLLVDDDETFREQLARALFRRGYDCRMADTGEAALEIARQQAPDAAVVDLRMPGISGIETVRVLHQLAPKARLLVLTGYGSIATALEAVRVGAADYLTKPVNADQVVAAIEGVTPHAEPAPATVPSLDLVEWEHIQRVLHDCDGNISKAAGILGVHRRSLQRKLNRYAPGR